MRTDVRLPLPRRPRTTAARILIVDGFGQHPRSPVTHEVAHALRHLYPHADVPDPLATAAMVGDDVALQADFTAQADRVHDAVTAGAGELHVYAYSQGCIPVAEVLAAQHHPHVASVTLVGAPLRASSERQRIAELDVSGMGGVFEYVEAHTPKDTPLAGVVGFQPANNNRLYVGITMRYTTSFPADHTHYRNLAATIRGYPTTLAVCGAENVTDCTPSNARVFAAAVGIPYTTTTAGVGGGSRAVVLPGAPHRLGHHHRTVTIPALYRAALAAAQL